jgi:hypothetical protein
VVSLGLDTALRVFVTESDPSNRSFRLMAPRAAVDQQRLTSQTGFYVVGHPPAYMGIVLT